MRGGTWQRDSSTPLRCARNDMWVAGIAEKGGAGQNGGMGPRIRKDNGGRNERRDLAARFLDSASLRSE